MAVSKEKLQRLIEQAVDHHFEQKVIGGLRAKRLAALAPQREEKKEEEEESPEDAGLLEAEFNAAYGQQQ